MFTGREGAEEQAMSKQRGTFTVTAIRPRRAAMEEQSPNSGIVS